MLRRRRACSTLTRRPGAGRPPNFTSTQADPGADNRRCLPRSRRSQAADRLRHRGRPTACCRCARSRATSALRSTVRRAGPPAHPSSTTRRAASYSSGAMRSAPMPLPERSRTRTLPDGCQRNSPRRSTDPRAAAVCTRREHVRADPSTRTLTEVASHAAHEIVLVHRRFDADDVRDDRRQRPRVAFEYVVGR